MAWASCWPATMCASVESGYETATKLVSALVHPSTCGRKSAVRVRVRVTLTLTLILTW